MSVFACVFVREFVFILCEALPQNQYRRWIFVIQILKQHVRMKVNPKTYKVKPSRSLPLLYNTHGIYKHTHTLTSFSVQWFSPSLFYWKKRASESKAVPERSFDVRPAEHRLFHVLKAPRDVLSIKKRVRVRFQWKIHDIYQELVKIMYI